MRNCLFQKFRKACLEMNLDESRIADRLVIREEVGKSPVGDYM
jgi:hypothetical protein